MTGCRDQEKAGNLGRLSDCETVRLAFKRQDARYKKQEKILPPDADFR